MQWMKGGEDGVRTIIGGYFNARTGGEWGEIRMDKEIKGERREEMRCTRNEKINGDGRELIAFIEGRGWSIFNGDRRG